ncbi:MAG TPA: TetR/AcrR family transcriptional regulator [Actinomycetota bacterium]|jgi:AcrR family transcriptional regulator|nr:TetR/AcrR family transcriptional regulator [Actinomycetota bacterium]
MPKVSEEIRRGSRARLIDAARRCAATKGFRTFTVDDVCSEAGVSKGAFYTYFDRKDDLLVAMVENDAAEYGRLMQRLRRQGASLEQIREVVRAALRRGQDAAQVQLQADLWSEMQTNDVIRKPFAESVRERRSRLSDLIEDTERAGELVTVPANALAAVLIALSDGLLLHRALDPSGFRWSNIGIVLDLMLDGLLKKSKP